MGTPRRSDESCQRAVDLLVLHGNNRTAAALAMGIARSTFNDALNQAEKRKIRPSASIPPRTAADIVEETRAKKQASSLRSENADLREELLQAQDIRSAILGLGPPAIARVGMNKLPKLGKNNRSVLLHVSDIQYGELIKGAEVDWVNSYSVDIANARIDRLFDMFGRLCTDHWHGPPPVDIHICLGGDMVSGALHEELAKTDELPELPAAKAVAARLAGNIRKLRDRLDRPVRLYSVPGNHGRLTHKPESKGHVMNNLDTLVAWFIEAALSQDKDVSVSYSESVDALFNIFNFPFLLTHGDRMGGKGGTGHIGPIAPISKGHQKLFMDAAARGTSVYKILTGHYHTAAETSWGFANSALAGWSQFARDLRLKAEPATQNMFVIHPEHGVISKHAILAGVPSEGRSHDPAFLWKAAA